MHGHQLQLNFTKFPLLKIHTQVSSHSEFGHACVPDKHRQQTFLQVHSYLVVFIQSQSLSDVFVHYLVVDVREAYIYIIKWFS